MTPTQTHPATTNERRSAHRPVATALTVCFLIVVTFQLALAFGAPFGEAALGGANSGRLPGALRAVTALQALVWLGLALIVLARGGFAISPVRRRVAYWGTWAIVGILSLAMVLNVASSSPWERYGWAPFILIMLALSVVLARTDADPHRQSAAPSAGLG